MEKENRNLALVEEKAYNIRLHMQVTQKEFAHLLGVSPSYVSNWENGYNEITIGMLNKICNISNTSFDFMMGFTNEVHKDIKKIEKV